MKKRFLSMILLAVISFSLVACGNSETINNEPKASEVNSQQEAEEPQEIEQSKKNEKFNLYQEWKDIQTGESFVFDKDGTVIYKENAYKYEYNEKIDVITVYLSSSINLNVIEEALYNHAYCADAISLTTIPIYYLQPNTRIFVRDDNTFINGEYIINKISFSLAFNGMSTISANKAISSL